MLNKVPFWLQYSFSSFEHKFVDCSKYRYWFVEGQISSEVISSMQISGLDPTIELGQSTSLFTFLANHNPVDQEI